MCNNPVLLRDINGSLYKKYNKYPSVVSYMDSIQIPCGGCLGCRLDNVALWSARCNYELYKNRSAFVTFTYDDYHLPYYDDMTLKPSLRRDDLHKFIDNLRHKVKKISLLPSGSKKDFSYFACGEYGGKFGRPHYHVLFFGLDFADFSRLFNDTWKYGLIKTLPILSGGVRYVVDYFTKEKLTGKLAEEKYDKQFLERPFNLCSRGLGSELFFTHRDDIRNGKDLTIGSRVVPVPSYYKNLYGTYSDSEVIERTKMNYERYKDIVKASRKNNFSNVDSYLAYIRKSNELALESQMRRKNISVLSSYKDLDSSIDIQILSRYALDV